MCKIEVFIILLSLVIAGASTVNMFISAENLARTDEALTRIEEAIAQQDANDTARMMAQCVVLTNGNAEVCRRLFFGR